jgi:hypothetical protein
MYSTGSYCAKSQNHNKPNICKFLFSSCLFPGFLIQKTRGLENVSEQALLTAACQNLKEIATYLVGWKRCVAILYVDLAPVDWSGRCEDSCGSTGQGRPRRSEATRRLPEPPAESEASGAEINRPSSMSQLFYVYFIFFWINTYKVPFHLHYLSFLMKIQKDSTF